MNKYVRETCTPAAVMATEILASTAPKAEATQNSDVPQMIPIRRRGNKLPLFIVHTPPVPIKWELGPDRPIYFFRALWNDGRLPSSLDLKSLATDYVRQVKAIQPEEGSETSKD